MSGLRALLQDAASGNLTSLPGLHTLAGISAREAAEFCRVPWDTYRRYGRDRPAPDTVLRLLTLRAGWLPWPGWDSFYFCAFEGRLYHAGLRDGFGPAELLELHWLRQEVRVLRALRLGVRDNPVCQEDGERRADPVRDRADPGHSAAKTPGKDEMFMTYSERDKPKATRRAGARRVPSPMPSGNYRRIHYAHIDRDGERGTTRLRPKSRALKPEQV